MARDWAAVEELIRDLGCVRRAADSLRVEEAGRLAVDRAIHDAAETLDQTIDGPNSHERLTAARQAIGVAIEVILALDVEIGRSLRIRSRAATLSQQAAALMRKAVRDRCILFLPRRPLGHERIAEMLDPLAQSGCVVKVERVPGADVWRIEVAKGTRTLSFQVPRAASSPEWEDVVRRALEQ
jgi:hypothetical protein